MAIVASLDLTNYLQAVSPPSWIGHARYMDNGRCSMAHSRSSADLLRSAAVYELTPSTRRLDDDRDGGLRSRDTGKAAGATVETQAGDSGFSSDSSEETNPASSSSSSSSAPCSGSSTRKRVSFADDVGLALVTVRRYDVPAATVDDVVPAQRPACRRRVRLDPAFRQPWLDPTGLRCRLDRDGVALESATGRGRGLPFSGTVLVANVAFEKRVTVRCTFDFWRSFVDVAAVYVTSGSAGTDLFAFEVQPDLTAVGDRPWPGPVTGGRVQFAVRYQYRPHSDAVWCERWDNNDARNYQMMVTW